MGEQGKKRGAKEWLIGLPYDRELWRMAAKLYYWIAALVFAGIGVWVLTPYSSFTADTPKMSPGMQILVSILGSGVLFGLSGLHIVLARRADAD